MSSGMNVKEAEKIADKMSYREAIMNCLHARCVPYRKATKIKMKRLLASIDNDFTDDLLNQGYTKAYQQGRADEQLQSIEDAKEQAKEYRVALEKAKADGAREFLSWYSGGETMPSFGRYANYKIDDVIAEWQKTYKQNVE